jgi:hypothetical protein
MRRSPDWRIWLGLGVTTAWLLLGSLYISANLGWLNLHRIPADELGNFLEGAFAPLAFLWLVIGYFLQQKGAASAIRTDGRDSHPCPAGYFSPGRSQCPIPARVDHRISVHLEPE